VEWLGEEFTVLAFDTPGYGNSTPLPVDEPDIAAFSRAFADTLTALGIDRCAIYGCHSSSKIALQFAVDHPERAALTVLDGLSLPAHAPGEDFLRAYLMPFAPTIEGDYIARQWSKVLDFHRYFPWFSRVAASRFPMDLPDDRHLHVYATDVFMAGPGWTGAYGAALRYLAKPWIPLLSSPTVFMCREGDVLYSHLDSLPERLPEQCRIERVPASVAAWRARLLEILRSGRLPDAGWTPPVPAPHSTAAGSRQRYVDLVHGQVRIRTRGPASSAIPVLLLHDLPGSPRQVEGLARLLSVDRLTIVPDLPGLGESDPLPSPTLGAYVSVLDEMLKALGIDSVDVVAEGLGTVFAAALAANRPQRVRRIVLDGVPVIRSRDRKRFVREYCPPVVPDRAGSHLLRLWEQLRTTQITWPWFGRSASAARVRDAQLDALELHDALVAAMKQPDYYGDAARAALDAAVRDIAKAIAQPVLVMQDVRDVRYGGIGSLRRRLQQATVVPRSAVLAERAAACLEFLG
jgi:pimeloyl-ACP methyl ester carboxylesterase